MAYSFAPYKNSYCPCHCNLYSTFFYIKNITNAMQKWWEKIMATKRHIA